MPIFWPSYSHMASWRNWELSLDGVQTLNYKFFIFDNKTFYSTISLIHYTTVCTLTYTAIGAPYYNPEPAFSKDLNQITLLLKSTNLFLFGKVFHSIFHRNTIVWGVGTLFSVMSGRLNKECMEKMWHENLWRYSLLTFKWGMKYLSKVTNSSNHLGTEP